MRHTLALLAAGLLAGGPLAHAQSVAITNAKVYTMTGPALERATVLIRDGKIARGREYETRQEALEAAGLRE